MSNYFKRMRGLKARALKYYTDLKYLPLSPNHDDLYIIDYPKSGITWLSVLLANVNLKCSSMDIRANFYNVRDFVPDIYQARNIKKEILPFPWFRIIKSHSRYNRFYKKIIYLIRDPRDVMVSYYHYSTSLDQFSGTLSEFIRSNGFGIDSWISHVESWLDNSNAAQFINFIRYEDMKSNTKSILVRIYKLHGMDISDEVFDYAIDASTFQKMKDSEEYYRQGNPTLNPNFSFHRKGVAGSFKADLTEEDEAFIVKKAERIMQMFGYL